MMKKVSIGLVQMASAIGKVEENVRRAKAYIDDGAAKGAGIVCLPELFSTGYFCHSNEVNNENFKLAESIPGPTTEELGNTARRHCIYIIAPIFEKAAAGYYHNSAALIDSKGTVCGKFRKVHVPWSAWGWEKYYFRPGYDFPVFKTECGKIGIMICYDRFFPESARLLALRGAEIIFCPAGAPLALGESWEFILRTRAMENQLFVAGVGLTGRVGTEYHEVTGRSLVIGPQGEIIGQLDREEGILQTSIDLNAIEEARIGRFDHRDRRPEVYGILTEFSQG